LDISMLARLLFVLLFAGSGATFMRVAISGSCHSVPYEQSASE
jgi:hypothetical protein